jgi:tRNA(fMet)-specific endonuclease VapC
MILDTTFLVDVLRGDSDVASRLEAVEESGAAFVSAVTIMELAEGIRLAEASDAERRAVIELLEEVTELPFDRPCAMRAGELNADLVASGDPVDETDVMIAATALVHGYPVVTRNRSHFDRFDGLEVVSY